MAPELLQRSEVLELCGERFIIGDVIPPWRYEGSAGTEARAILEIQQGDASDVLQRMLGRGAWASFRRAMLRLESRRSSLGAIRRP
jgi:hypothetical protein